MPGSASIPTVLSETSWKSGVAAASGPLNPRMMLLAHYYMGGEIVKLVEHYGGRIALVHDIGQGAAFEFRLPWRRPAPPQDHTGDTR